MTLNVDDREVTEHSNIPELLDIPITIQRMEASDYAFLSYTNDPVGIERSEVGNLTQKLRSGELESQMRTCADNFSIIYLLIEGVFDKVEGLLAVYRASERGYYRSHIYPNTYYKTIMAVLTSMSAMGVRLIFTPNLPCSMDTIRCIYNEHTKPTEQHSLFRSLRPVVMPAKLSTNPAIPRLLNLCPRLTEKTAIRLINKYGSIWQILNTPDKELLEVEGLGKTLLTRLRASVGKND